MLSLLDWISFIFVSVGLFYWIWFYAKRKQLEDPKYAYLPLGFLIKIVGGSFFAIIFFYVYGVGDTFLYWSGSKQLSSFFWEDPQMYFQALFSNSEAVKELIPGIYYEIPYARTHEEWFMVRILSVFNIISFDNYLMLMLWTIGFSLLGSWTIFEVINSWFKGNTKLAFICSFAIPTVVVWSGGIIKDSLAFGMIGLLIYSFYRLFFFNKLKNIFLWFTLILSFIIIFNLKSYLVICLTPALLLALYLKFKSSIRNPLLRKLSGPLLFVFMIGAMLALVQSIALASEKYEIKKLEQKARGFHTWHVTTGGATYNLGEIEYTASGVAKKIPAALNVSFFRPYPWEVKNLGMAIAAVESSIIFLLFLYLILYKGLKSIQFIFRDPLLAAFITFSLILGFAAGFTSYNFGALVRYKMPFMPFLTFTLLYIANLKRKNKLN